MPKVEIGKGGKGGRRGHTDQLCINNESAILTTLTSKDLFFYFMKDPNLP